MSADKMTEQEFSTLLTQLQNMKPKYVPATPEQHAYFESILPILKDQALSELRRNNEFMPRLLGFMSDGTLAYVDVTEATGGVFGSARSKQAVSLVHRLASMAPGCKASVFCCETWVLRNPVEPYEPGTSIAEHPDREEAVMFNMITYNREQNTVAQLFASTIVLKVLGNNVSRSAWRDTTLGDTEIRDPLAGTERMVGRFILGGDDGKDEG